MKTQRTRVLRPLTSSEMTMTYTPRASLRVVGYLWLTVLGWRCQLGVAGVGDPQA